MLIVLFLACHGVEPLDLPADASKPGVPVGVRTVTHQGVTFEVWYPASDRDADEPKERADLEQFVPDAFFDHIGDFDVPSVSTRAIRDARVRKPESPYPVVLFSHGFAGFRLQSVDFTTHLASRGYVVVAPDHRGRMLTDTLPCLFTPPIEGCSLSFGGEDPAPADLLVAAGWVEDADETFLEGVVDAKRMGLSGHSAGAASTGTLGSLDDRFRALLPMAYGPTVTRDVPTLTMGATCDAVVPFEDIEAGVAGSVDATLFELPGAGHLAFSDLCEVDLTALGRDLLLEREDLNTTLYDLLHTLGSDGCPQGEVAVPCGVSQFAPLDASMAVIRGEATAFFDHQL